MLLGLPWLWDIKASIEIRNSQLRIGDPKRGEARITIQGLILSLQQSHRLALDTQADSDVAEFDTSASSSEMNNSSSDSSTESDEDSQNELGF